MGIEKEIIFKTVNGGKNRDPKWVPVKAKNATCPQCNRLMIVVSGEVEYAFCYQCQQYFVPDKE